MLTTLAAIVLLGLGSGAPQASSVPAEARATIARANAEWVAALKAHDAAAVAAPYAEDGIFVTATGNVVKGRQAIEAMTRDRFPQMGTIVSGTIVQDGVTRQGTSIYEWGHADLTLAHEGGSPQRSRARYLTVWQKSAAGRWEIVRNLSLPD